MKTFASYKALQDDKQSKVLLYILLCLPETNISLRRLKLRALASPSPVAQNTIY